MGIKVTLRQKPISKGRKSLYLDIYPPIENIETGKPTRRDFLGLYILDKPKTVKDKQVNKETLQLAERICEKRSAELNKPEIYTASEKEQLKLKANEQRNFIEYFEKLLNKREGSNQSNWNSAFQYLKLFAGDEVKFADLDTVFFDEFKAYLLSANRLRSKHLKLGRNSAVSYFNKVKAALKRAFKDGILSYDLNAKIDPIKPEETHREYLTIDELQSLIKTPCNDPLLKRAALFSTLTGLRFSDIKKLTWQELEYSNDTDGYSIHFIQKKTKGAEVLPISEQAYNLLGTKGEPEHQIFEGLDYSAYMNKHLFQWIGAAGITKNITFHCFRHTYATLQLANGTDITTLQKMMGHKDLKTTLLYAKVVDRAKREAADKIKLKF